MLDAYFADTEKLPAAAPRERSREIQLTKTTIYLQAYFKLCLLLNKIHSPRLKAIVHTTSAKRNPNIPL